MSLPSAVRLPFRFDAAALAADALALDESVWQPHFNTGVYEGDWSGVALRSSGGLVARGHPLAATGIAQVVEIVSHIRGRAGARQVQGARLGLAVNTGGIIEGDAGYVGVTAVGGPR